MLGLLQPLRRFDVLLVDHPDRAFRAQCGPVRRFLFFQTIPKHVDPVVEVCFHTVFQFDPLAIGVGRDREIEAPLVDNFVVVDISFSLVEKVHLQGKERELQHIGNEGKGFRCVLLLKKRGIFPAAFGEGLLDMFRL